MSPLSALLEKTRGLFSPFICPHTPCESEPRHPSFYYETYDEITANLTAEQKELLKSSIRGEAPPQIYAKVMKAIHEGTLTGDILNNEIFPLYALKALHDGVIDGMSFTTCILFYNVYRHAPEKSAVRFIPLFIGDSINDEAWHIVNSSAKSDRLQGRRVGRIKEEIAQFFELMRSAPLINRQFILVPKESAMQSETMGQLLIHQEEFTFLNSYQDQIKKETYRILPSKGMYQAGLTCRGGKDTPKLVTRFLLSSAELIEAEILEGKRSFCLNFWELPQITTADGRECERKYNEVELHDFFHGELITSTPPEDRKKLYGFAQAARHLAKENEDPAVRKFLTCIAEQFIDMEQYVYLNNQSSPTQLDFWSIVWGNIYAAFVMAVPGALLVDGDTIIKKLFDQGGGLLFLEELIEKADHYKKEYGIDIKELLRLRRIELSPRAELSTIFTKKMSIRAEQLLNTKLQDKSLVKAFLGLGIPTNSVISSRAWKLLRKQYLPTYFTQQIKN